MGGRLQDLELCKQESVYRIRIYEYLRHTEIRIPIPGFFCTRSEILFFFEKGGEGRALWVLSMVVGIVL